MALAKTTAISSIQRMAARETGNLALANVLVAKKLGELDRQLTQQRAAPDAPPQSPVISGREMAEAVATLERRWDLALHVGRLVDRTA